jgi:hypothetical protein
MAAPTCSLSLRQNVCGACRNLSDNVWTRETREGWPLLSATEMNGDSKSTNERVPPWLVSLGLVVPAQEIVFYLGCSSRLVQNIFPHFTLFQIFVPSPSWAAIVLCRLSLSMCLWCGKIGFLTNKCYKCKVPCRFTSA